MTQPLTAGRPAPGADDAETVAGLIKKARRATAGFANADQGRACAAAPALALVPHRPAQSPAPLISCPPPAG